jgi:hypothetical protein
MAYNIRNKLYKAPLIRLEVCIIQHLSYKVIFGDSADGY